MQLEIKPCFRRSEIQGACIDDIQGHWHAPARQGRSDLTGTGVLTGGL